MLPSCVKMGIWHVKRRFRILYKKTECRLFNLKYIVMASVMLHNLCMDVDDPCLPHWGLHVKNTSLIREQVEKQKTKNLLCELLKYLQKQPSRGVLRKRCSENMQQIYRRTTMVRHGCFPKSLLHIFRAPFPKNTSGLAASAFV